MAGTTTQWILELVDNITGPAQAATSSSNTLADSVEKINDKLDKTSNAGRSAGDTLETFGRRMMYLNQISDVVGKMSSEFDALVAPGERFQYSMANLQAIAGVTGETFDLIGDKARASAQKFGGDAANAVDSYTVLLSKLGPQIANYPEALASMGESVMLTSKMMKNDAASAVDALTTAMNKYGVSIDDPVLASKAMSEIMNIMAAASKEGSAELMQQKAALEQCGGEARQANISFAETISAIQVLDKAGKSASEGGVALRNVLTTLGQGRFMAKDVQLELAKVGISAEMLNDQSLSLSDRLKILRPVLEDSALFSKMFGRETAGAAMALVQGIPKLEEYTQAVSGTKTAEEQAAIMMGTRLEKKNQNQAFWDDMKISVFGVAESLIPFTQFVGTAMEKVVLFGMTIFSTSQIMSTSMGKSVLASMKSLVTLQFSFHAAAKSISAAIFSIPIIGWVALAITLLGGLGVYFYKTSETFRGMLSGMWEGVRAIFGNMGGFIKDILSGVWEIIKSVFNPANWFGDGDGVKDGIAKIATAAKDYGEAIGSSFASGREKGIESYRAEIGRASCRERVYVLV